MPAFSLPQNARRFIDRGLDMSRGAYEKLPGGSILPQHTRTAWKKRSPRAHKLIITTIVALLFGLLVLSGKLYRGHLHRPLTADKPPKNTYKWSHYPE